MVLLQCNMEIAMKDVTRVHAPMILPWLAHKAGISDRRAEILWASALRHADHRGGAIGTSAYWQAAMDRLDDLIALESQHEDEASFGWRPWLRTMYRNWETPIVLWDELTQPYIRSWRHWSRDHLTSC
jgi:hypothetical protein